MMTNCACCGDALMLCSAHDSDLKDVHKKEVVCNSCVSKVLLIEKPSITPFTHYSFRDGGRKQEITREEAVLPVEILAKNKMVEHGKTKIYFLSEAKKYGLFADGYYMWAEEL